DWFGILFFVLFGGVLSNTFRGGWRRLLRPRKWGFVVTHAGVMILLVSAFWGRLTEQRGIVQLHLGEASSSFQGYDGIGRPFKAPTLSGDEPLFGVRLEGFRADYHDVLDVIYATEDGERLAEEFTGLEPPKFRVYQDQVLHFDWGQDAGLPTTLAEAGSASLAPWLRLEVTEYIPQSVNKPILRGSKDGEEGVPMARIASVHPQAGIEEEGILFHHFPMPFSDAQSGARVLFRKVNEVEEAVALATEPVVEHFGWIRQKMPVGMEARDPMEVRPGAEFAVRSGGQELKVEIVKAVPVLRLRRGLDGRVEHDPQETGPSWMKATNPGVLVKIYGNDGILEERWVAEQAAHGAEATLFPGVEFEFAWDPWSAPALSRWWIFQNTAGQCWLAEAGKPDTMKEIKPGERWPVSADRSLELLQAFPSALSEQTMDSLVGADFFHPAPGSIRLKITTPKGVEEQVLSAEGQGDWHRVRYLGPDGQARLVLLHFRRDTDDLPLEWRSKLAFHKVDPHGEWLEESAGEIRVNDYYFHRGYRFFQTDARPDDPTYSGVGVVYDPGIEGVLIGLYMVMFGTLVVFLVNPLVTRKHRGA
ncbi:MAG: cytochrome c biogenesis protein ResB, partial [Planctomycetes bacterium]|nr:cytochrome c biogenesis protein ResB [Planctomycetota bacterium]